MKTPVYLLIIAILAITTSAATITLTPGSVYETTKNWQTADVNNYKASTIVYSVAVTSPGLTITDIEDYTGWTEAFSSSTANWSGGSIETNVKSAVFEFEAQAPTVTQDTNTTITVTAGNSTTFNIIILNDATPPNITNVQPNNYAKANNPSQSITVTATDQETSVATVTYKWNDCAGGNNTNVTLTKVNDTYAGTADFTSFDEGEKACYVITATNAPGETATLSGELIFDGTPPTVTLNSPLSFTTENTTFSFSASDNLAAQLSCTLKLGSNALTTLTVQNGTTTTNTQDLSSFSEGSQTWSVECKDGVGLTATKVQSVLLDTAAPIVTVSYNPFVPRTQSSIFTAIVTDTVGLSNVGASYESSNVTLSSSGNDYSGTISSNTLGTKTLTVTAEDNVGHTTVKTETITIVPNHQITLALTPTSADVGETITASGTVTGDGNLTETEITLKTPAGDFTLTLDSNGDFTKTFSTTNDGTYTITAEYEENGYTYKAEEDITIIDPSSPGSSQYSSSSNGYNSDWNGTAGYVKPGEQPSSSDSNAVVPDEPVQESAPQGEYTPRQAEQPRSGLTPQATGIFKLGGAIKWLAILLALALIAGLGAYAWNKRGKDDTGINWDSYFKGK